MEKLYERTDEIGIDYQDVIEYLRILEWQVKNDNLVHSQTGEKIKDPYAWFLGAMLKTGYYAKPKGYLSLADYKKIEEEQNHVLEKISEKRIFDAKLKTWKESLTPEELQYELSQAKGPEDVRLRIRFKLFLGEWCDDK